MFQADDEVEYWKQGGQGPRIPKGWHKMQFCTVLYLFIVLNEMFPLVYFLVGYVENNFWKHCCNSYVGGSCVTKK